LIYFEKKNKYNNVILDIGKKIYMTKEEIIQNKQVKSKKRVADHGEVFTSEREVNAMLDLVKQETERIDSRFLEPACGTGNFLVEILRRKLAIVENRYKKSQLEYERYAIIAISSIYGIDLLDDNIEECRHRLFEIFNKQYISFYKSNYKIECINTVKYILEKNIIKGDALSLKTQQNGNESIVFSEWSAVNGSMIKRRDFMLSFMLEPQQQMSLFNDDNKPYSIPEPVREFPLTHFLKLANNE
jgi:RNA processing factor Prp31